MKTPISKRVQYLIRRSLNEQGVTGAFIKRLRTDVRACLGMAGFRFLEDHLDAKDGRWYVSIAFSWPRLLLNSGTEQEYEAYNIHYDTDDGHYIRGLPAKVTFKATSLQEAKLKGADIISDKTGWCVSAFQVRRKPR